jgi:hypothetical protein
MDLRHDSREADMDEARYRELDRKRRDVGLTDEEANELGRMMAEQENEPYSNAEMESDDREARKSA